MSVEVDYIYHDWIFQADEIGGWVWPVGYPADGRYRGLSVVPELANLAVCQLLDHWFATDNSQAFHMTIFFNVKVVSQHLDSNLQPDFTFPGGQFGVKLIRAPSV